ncbi:Ig-like domain repeat protein [Nocardia sp. 2]|uniref:Ig-like domain repeat protein n=1 Tax=Nocardia acididurans TaxID=2802282 RepID=A0ABS1LZ93_9NOCA|nr:Ig-like domain repeat protein [Nocardia acididurans]MBL1073234.1 Ig-like domain repeat protein [Nocardia acididurans]
MSITKRAGFGTALLGAMATAALVAAPQANALVTGLTGPSGTVYVGETYTLTADVTITSFLFDVTFSDNGTEIGKAKPSSSKATISWTPTTAGTHQIKAVQEIVSSKTITVTVTEKPTNPGGGTGSSGSNPLAGLLSSLSAK